MLTELSQDPHESNLTVILDDLISLHAADQRHEIINEVRILSQDIFEHLDSFSSHIGDLKREEVLELRADRLRQVGQSDDDRTEASD